MSVGSVDRPIRTHDESGPGRMGAVIVICGAGLSLLSFFVLPYVSVLSFSVTGAQLAGLSADARDLIYGDPGGEWLLAWWLVPLGTAAGLLVAILDVHAAAARPRKTRAAALVCIGTTVTVGLSAAFSYLASKSNSHIASAVTGVGFWLTMIGAVAISAGGVVLYQQDPRTAKMSGTDQPTFRERIVETLFSVTGSPGSPAASDKPVTSSGSGLQQSHFGPYRLESLIGQGAMGQVYRAVDTVRDRAVALKLLPAQLAVDPQFRSRFQSEAALAARLREPHIIPIHDYGEIDGRLFIDMRLVEGSDLARLLADQGPLSVERAVKVVTQVAAALDAAHAAGLAHRDIKPSNILFTNTGNGAADEFVYVADFGLARLTTDGTSSLTMTGTTVGSLGYMAPERFTGGHGDHRVDIYSLGCLLFETLTGHAPFPAKSIPAIIHAHLNQPPPQPSQEHPGLPAELDIVIGRAMAKNPDDRYASTGALAAAARAALSPLNTPETGIDQTRPEGVPFSQQETIVPTQHPTWTNPHRPPTDNPYHATPTNPDAATPRPQRRRLPQLALIAIALVVVAAVIGAFVVLFGTGPLADADIHTEPGPNPGVNPFMPPAGDYHPGVTPPPGSGGTITGNTSGLYGGTLNNFTCDRQAMINFLTAHPDKGAAWAQVQGINQADLPSYIASLTPVFLRSDTAVTNHGFMDGHATTLHSVLQAGTAVLVDNYGVPRARCFCGNPLTPADPPATKRYVGPTWSGFSHTSVTTITPAATPITEFALVNPYTNEIIYRPAGTAGDQDRPQTPPQATTSETPSVSPPTTPEPAQPAQPSEQTSQPPVQPTQPSVEPAQPSAQPAQPANEPPQIVHVSTYQEGEMVYFSLSYTDPNNDAEGFGFRGARGSGWGQETHPFSSPSYGHVSPGRVDYPFDLGCGTPSQYDSDVEAWIYDNAGLQSSPVSIHLWCTGSRGAK